MLVMLVQFCQLDLEQCTHVQQPGLGRGVSSVLLDLVH